MSTEQGPEKPFWQTVFVATSHCGAGCTLGDLIGESAIFILGFTALRLQAVDSLPRQFRPRLRFGISSSTSPSRPCAISASPMA